MNDQLFSEVASTFGGLTIEGLPIAGGVFVIVQLAKMGRLVRSDSLITPERLAILSAFILGLGWTAVEIEALGSSLTMSAVVGLLYRWIIGAGLAALSYHRLLKPLLQRLGWPAEMVQSVNKDGQVEPVA